MPSFICTLFEKHYHHGVAALINSLYNNNFRGSLYAGYKGTLPSWCSSSKPDPKIAWAGASTFQVAPDFQVHFLPIDTSFHFVFYKPFFLLELFKLLENDADSITYFDPDIVIKCKWAAFETWMEHGVALVYESLNRPATHPIRGEWKKVIQKINRQPTRSVNAYINSGFCGVTKQNIEFVTVWAEVIEAGIKYYNLAEKQWGQSNDRTYLFYNADQDALNIAAMCCQSPISEVTPDGMDILPGGFLMSHALGRPKPWNKHFIRSALTGVGPTLAEKQFWVNTRSPIRLYSAGFLKVWQVKIFIASFISRFYKRS